MFGRVLLAARHMLDKLQKRVRRTVDPTLAASPWVIVKMWPASVFLVGINLVHNWLNWLCSLILVEDSLIIMRNSMIYQSPFLDVIKMSISTVSFFEQQGTEILSLLNAFL